MSDDAELTALIDRLRSGHDMLPFLTGMHPASGMELHPVPADMLGVLEASPDYRSPDPGEGPVWLQIATTDDAAELVPGHRNPVRRCPGLAASMFRPAARDVTGAGG